MDRVGSNPSIAHDLNAVSRAALVALCHEVGADPAQIVRPALNAFNAARNRPPVWPGVVRSLRRLKDDWGVRLGAITNGEADATRIAAFGDLFSFSVTAAEAGAAKPNAAPFELAIARAGVPARCIAHVGDDPETDVSGAKAAGMRAILVSGAGVGLRPPSHRALPGTQPLPDLELNSVNDLPSCSELARWCGVHIVEEQSRL